jgi:general stress protein 26
LFPQWVSCQSQQQNDSSQTHLLTTAKEIMVAAGNCALITLDQEGHPRVRIMDPFLPEDDFTVWFGTNQKSRKVKQIQHDQRVTLYYVDNDKSGYVTLHGIAQLVDDQKEKDIRWKDAWKNFYPNKDRDYLLIKVVPEWMEVLSITRGINGDTVTWQPPEISFKKK